MAKQASAQSYKEELEWWWLTESGGRRDGGVDELCESLSRLSLLLLLLLLLRLPLLEAPAPGLPLASALALFRPPGVASCFF